MIAVVISKEDEASCNIGHMLQSLDAWKQEGELQGEPILGNGSFFLVTIKDTHLYHNHIDKEIRESLGAITNTVIFASRHKSQSKRKTLSVHPLGNYANALYGGKKQKLVPSNPLMMLRALQKLYQKKIELNLSYDVCYEVTHHGPFLSSPSFFIEIGSSPREWQDKSIGKIVAEVLFSILSDHELLSPATVALGFGGGHYALRFTDIALRDNIAFGHMLPSYHLNTISPGIIDHMIVNSPGVTTACFYGAVEDSLTEWVSNKGLRVL